MDIAIIADDSKKELMAQFCIAYAGILSLHNICATQVTGKYISEASNLDIELLMPGSEGGGDSMNSGIKVSIDDENRTSCPVSCF